MLMDRLNVSVSLSALICTILFVLFTLVQNLWMR